MIVVSYLTIGENTTTQHHDYGFSPFPCPGCGEPPAVSMSSIGNNRARGYAYCDNPYCYFTPNVATHWPSIGHLVREWNKLTVSYVMDKLF